MKPQQKQKIAYLFRELGEVDDALLQEALIYRPQRNMLSRVLMVAACLTMSFLLCFGVLLISLRSKDSANDFDPPPMSDTPNASSLDQLLVTQAEIGIHTTLQSADEADFFGGKGYVVWQYADGTVSVTQGLERSE